MMNGMMAGMGLVWILGVVIAALVIVLLVKMIRKG